MWRKRDTKSLFEVKKLDISKKGINRPLLPRSWFNLFSKLLLVKDVKSGALIGQNRVKRERERRGLVIPIFDIFYPTEETLYSKNRLAKPFTIQFLGNDAILSYLQKSVKSQSNESFPKAKM